MDIGLKAFLSKATCVNVCVIFRSEVVLSDALFSKEKFDQLRRMEVFTERLQFVHCLGQG